MAKVPSQINDFRDGALPGKIGYLVHLGSQVELWRAKGWLRFMIEGFIIRTTDRGYYLAEGGIWMPWRGSPSLFVHDLDTVKPVLEMSGEEIEMIPASYCNAMGVEIEGDNWVEFRTDRPLDIELETGRPRSRLP